MVIAVNAKYFLKAYEHDYSKFVWDCFNRLANQHPQHTFIFFSSAPPEFSPQAAQNLRPVVIRLKPAAGIFSGILYGLKISSLLKKQKVNIFVNADAVCSIFVKVSQCFILYNPDSLSSHTFLKKNHLFLYKKCMPFIIKKAKVIITESAFSKNYISRRYKAVAQKTDVIYDITNDFSTPIEWELKQQIKMQYAEGNEYFIFYGDTSAQNILVNLLKAYSTFKKWQKSGMQLLVVVNNPFPQAFRKSFRLFRYKQDVKFLDGTPVNELLKLSGAAYAMIYFPPDQIFSNPVLRSMNSNVPLIIGNGGRMPEICGEAALYVNINDPADIAEKFMLMFKNEKLRQELIERGKHMVQKHNWEKTTELFWNSILKASG